MDWNRKFLAPNGFGFDWSEPNHVWGSAYNGFDPVSNNIVNTQGGYANPDTGPYCRLEITGFIPGQEYQVQFIVADSRAAQYGRSVTIEPVSLDGNTLLGNNAPTVQYAYNNYNNNGTFAVVTADFVADATAYGFVPWCLDSSSSPTGPQINAIRITTPPAATPPSFTSPPLSRAAGYANEPLSVSVSANGATPLYYQWLKNGTNIPSATSTTLNFNSLALADAGDYQVIVSNASGTITSPVMDLTVIAPPDLANFVQPAGEATRYSAQGDSVIGHNQGRFFNRPLYINNTSSFRACR